MRMSPSAAEAAASHWGRPVSCARASPAAATRIDSSAAESSRSTVGSVGSRASRMKRRIGSPRPSVRNEGSATPSDIPSNTTPPDITTNAPGQVLPRRLGYVRSGLLEPIESYRERIPDHALLKYDDAVQSGLFDKFWVATPTYYQERQVDPWIVAEVGGADRWAVIARWD